MLTDQRIRVLQPNSQDRKAYVYAHISSSNELIVHHKELGSTASWPKELLRCELANTSNERIVSFIKSSIWHR